MTRKIKPIIGLEIHVQLKTKTKMFCSCDTQYFHSEPNSHMCPVCLGLPGALPVPNKEGIKLSVKSGLALNCTINNYSRWDRKNYMYPDLFKGYQITQYVYPIASNGYVDINLPASTGNNSKKKRIRILRAHLEEDTAKSIHETDYTLIDGNKAGVPLLEIVSEPDMNSSEEAKLYAQKVYNTLIYAGVSDCDLEKGQMRFDVNVNIEVVDEYEDKTITRVTPIVEMKNMNSFADMVSAIEFEFQRQEKELDETNIEKAAGNKTTRGWNSLKSRTFLLRSKEEAEDYRYFPEPDLLPVYIDDVDIDKIQEEIGDLPDKIYDDLSNMNFPDEIVTMYTSSYIYYKYLKETLQYIDNINVYTFIKNELKSVTGENPYILNPEFCAEIIRLLIEKRITNLVAKDLINLSIESGLSPIQLANDKKLFTTIEGLDEQVIEVIRENADAVNNYKGGKESSLMFLVGQVMKKAKGRTDPVTAKEKLLKLLKEDLK